MKLRRRVARCCVGLEYDGPQPAADRIDLVGLGGLIERLLEFGELLRLLFRKVMRLRIVGVQVVEFPFVVVRAPLQDGRINTRYPWDARADAIQSSL